MLTMQVVKSMWKMLDRPGVVVVVVLNVMVVVVVVVEVVKVLTVHLARGEDQGNG